MNKKEIIIEYDKSKYFQLIIPIAVGGYYFLTQNTSLIGVTVIILLFLLFGFYIIKDANEVVFSESGFEISNVIVGVSTSFKYSEINKVKYLSGGHMRQPGIKIFMIKTRNYEFDFQFQKAQQLFQFLKTKDVKTGED